MPTRTKDNVSKIIAIAAVITALGTTAAAAYFMGRAPEKTTVVYQQPASHQVARNECDDKNIVGTLAGAAAGGIIGSNVGDGKGKTAATIGGTLGGAYLGNKYIPARGASCG